MTRPNDLVFAPPRSPIVKWSRTFSRNYEVLDGTGTQIGELRSDQLRSRRLCAMRSRVRQGRPRTQAQARLARVRAKARPTRSALRGLEPESQAPSAWFLGWTCGGERRQRRGCPARRGPRCSLRGLPAAVCRPPAHATRHPSMPEDHERCSQPQHVPTETRIRGGRRLAAGSHSPRRAGQRRGPPRAKATHSRPVHRALSRGAARAAARTCPRRVRKADAVQSDAFDLDGANPPRPPLSARALPSRAKRFGMADRSRTLRYLEAQGEDLPDWWGVGELHRHAEPNGELCGRRRPRSIFGSASGGHRVALVESPHRPPEPDDDRGRASTPVTSASSRSRYQAGSDS